MYRDLDSLRESFGEHTLGDTCKLERVSSITILQSLGRVDLLLILIAEEIYFNPTKRILRNFLMNSGNESPVLHRFRNGQIFDPNKEEVGSIFRIKQEVHTRTQFPLGNNFPSHMESYDCVEDVLGVIFAIPFYHRNVLMTVNNLTQDGSGSSYALYEPMIVEEWSHRVVREWCIRGDAAVWGDQQIDSFEIVHGVEMMLSGKSARERRPFALPRMHFAWR